MTIYNYHVRTMDGEEKPLSDYKENVLLIVNTASKCGFTPQLEGLQQLYDTFADQAFEILGFPCNQFANQDPGTNREIQNFCQKNYGVTFPVFSKINVKGDEKHPLYTYLTEEAKGLITKEVKWNFTKFLINKKGEVIERFAPQTKPENIKEKIEEQL